MRILARVLADVGIDGAIGADQDGYPGILGYQGPRLSEVADASVTSLAGFIESMMVRKSEGELALIRESARWCERAHRLLQDYTRPGVTEAEASLRAGQETPLAMLAELGEVGGLSSSAGASAGYRGQIGVRSSWAHAVAHAIEFHAGDMLVSETSAPIWGYNAELERGMIIGPRPTSSGAALRPCRRCAGGRPSRLVRPGATCADAVDGAVMRYFEDNGLLAYWRQHTGHGIGLRNHEAPFLDLGDHTVLQPGMVFTVEPGLYDSALGGFRHSDTVVVTEHGMQTLTDYPRDIESLAPRRWTSLTSFNH